MEYEEGLINQERNLKTMFYVSSLGGAPCSVVVKKALKELLPKE